MTLQKMRKKCIISFTLAAVLFVRRFFEWGELLEPIHYMLLITNVFNAYKYVKLKEKLGLNKRKKKKPRQKTSLRGRFY